jgi:hypothetical protein
MSAVDPSSSSGVNYSQSSSKSETQQAEIIAYQQILASMNSLVNSGAGNSKISDQVDATQEQINAIQQNAADVQAITVLNVICSNINDKNAINEIVNTMKKDPSQEAELLPQLTQHENNLSQNDLKYGTTEDLLKSLDSQGSEGS